MDFRTSPTNSSHSQFDEGKIDDPMGVDPQSFWSLNAIVAWEMGLAQISRPQH